MMLKRRGVLVTRTMMRARMMKTSRIDGPPAMMMITMMTRCHSSGRGSRTRSSPGSRKRFASSSPSSSPSSSASRKHSTDDAYYWSRILEGLSRSVVVKMKNNVDSRFLLG